MPGTVVDAGHTAMNKKGKMKSCFLDDDKWWQNRAGSRDCLNLGLAEMGRVEFWN